MRSSPQHHAGAPGPQSLPQRKYLRRLFRDAARLLGTVVGHRLPCDTDSV